jgi:hypothetical protein
VALVLLVASIWFAWVISHGPDGGVVAWLKIVLGLCAVLGALLTPVRPAAGWASPEGQHLPIKRAAVAMLAIWVVTDGIRERKSNLRQRVLGFSDQGDRHQVVMNPSKGADR